MCGIATEPIRLARRRCFGRRKGNQNKILSGTKVLAGRRLGPRCWGGGVSEPGNGDPVGMKRPTRLSWSTIPCIYDINCGTFCTSSRISPRQYVSRNSLTFRHECFERNAQTGLSSFSGRIRKPGRFLPPRFGLSLCFSGLLST